MDEDYNRCGICGDPIPEDYVFCDYCWDLVDMSDDVWGVEDKDDE